MHQNKLVNEASPYLRQHSNNPVHWLPWGEEAFALARQQDRPIFLSIGYSTCYWCHVMAHESFEDHEVADILNAKFVPIKVDREQRPDVDEVYMTAILALNGHGGWPMSIFLTPNLKPFWGGTYFPKDNFIQILRAIGSAWERERSSIINSASEITHALIERISSADRVATSPSEPVVADLFNHAFSYLQDSFDPAAGGFGEAPKFPPSQSLGFLLRLMATVSQQPLNWNAASALTLLTTTLDRMALGGIFDQLGGGFHRYSTDKNWTVPHFEKMLYDNALLARCYMEAGVYLSRPEYTRIAEATLGYMIRDLKGNLDAFVCAEDAGEPGQEGEFYTFSADELLANFSSAQLRELGAYFNLATPNFEQNRFILTANSFDAQTRASGSQAVSELLAFRASRSRPHRDDKILTSWNGLTISALAIGARFTGNPEYYHHASAAAKFILSQVRVGDVLAHCWCNATVSVPALLEDYAYFIEGLIELHQTELDEFWLSQAVRLAQEAELRLGQPPNALYAPSEARELIYTKHEWSDGAVPAPLSIMAKNLARLARLTGDLAYSDRSTLLQSEIVARIRAHPHTACSLLSGILEQHTDRALLKINLNNKTAQQALRSRFNRSFSPGTLILPLQGESGVMQLCTIQSCQPPIEDLARALSELSTLGSRAAIK